MRNANIGIPLGILSTKPFRKENPVDLSLPIFDGNIIDIGNTKMNGNAHNPISWNIGNGKLIQNNLSFKCKWPDIVRSGLIAGKEVTIDGLKFLGRIPSLEEDADLCDKFQIARGSYWAYSTKRMEQQPITLMHDGKMPVTVSGPANEYLRLILTPICPNLECLAGKRVRLVILNDCVITAHLQDVGTYDLTCTQVSICNGQISNAYAQWHADLNTLYIDRDAVVNAGEA